MFMPCVAPPAGGTGGGGSPAWEIDGASYTQQVTNGAPYQGISDIFIKSDGLRVFLVIGSGYVQHRTLSSAFDISSVGLPSTEDITAQTTSAKAIFIKSDGTRMYILGGSSVYQYTISSYDVTTSSYSSKSYSVTTQETTPTGLFFNDDGTKMYVLGEGNDTVYQYTLSTGWDVSTASYASISFSVASQATSPTGLSFSTSGDKMYVTNGGTDDKLYQYTLATPWNVSTASYDNKTLSLSDGGNAPNGTAFGADGLTLMSVDSGSGKISQYNI